MSLFWNGMKKADEVSLLDKVIIGKNINGSAEYADINQLKLMLSAYLTGQIIPSRVLPGAVLGAPVEESIYYAGPGNYQTPVGSLNLTENLNLLFWDKSSWSVLAVPIGVDLDGKVDKTAMGIPMGIATLGNDGKVIPTQISPVNEVFIDSYDAAQNIPNLNTAAATLGNYYLVSKSGTQTIKGKNYNLNVGDKIIFNGVNYVVIPFYDNGAPVPSSNVLGGKRIGNVIYDNYDRFTGEVFSATVVTSYTDGTAMNDGKVDGIIYFKNNASIGGGYSRRNFTGNAKIKWFGAKGDGTTDDTDALQAAINSTFNIEAENLAIYSTSPLLQTAVNQTLNFTNATLKLKALSNSAILTLRGHGSAVLGGKFDGNKGAGQSSSDPKFYNHCSINIEGNGCSVSGITSINSAGLAIKGGNIDDVLIEKCTLKDFDTQGIFIENYSRDCTGNRILNNIVYATKGIGIYLKSDNAGAVQQKRWDVSHNIVYGSSGVSTTEDICITIRGIEGVCSNNTTYRGDMGISLDRALNCVISGNRMEDPTGPTGYCLEVLQSNNVIEGNVCKGGRYGLSMSGATNMMNNNIISNNIFLNNSVSGLAVEVTAVNTARHLNITGNQFVQSVTGKSLLLRGDCRFAKISDNIFTGAGQAVGGTRGVYLEAVNSDIFITGNRFSKYETAIALYNNTATAVSNITVTNNDFTEDSGNLLLLEGTATYGANCSLMWNATSAGKNTVHRLDFQSNIIFGIFNAAAIEGNITAGIGSVVIKQNAGPGETFYIKETGTGATGWTALGGFLKQGLASNIKTISQDTAFNKGDFTILFSTGGTNRTYTLGLAAATPGKVMNFKKIDNGSGAAIIATTGGELIDDSTTKSISALNGVIRVQSDGVNKWIIIG